MSDPRTPVVVGVAQLNRRPSESELVTATEPVDMMADVVRAAADDARAGSDLLSRVTGLRVLRVTEWHYADVGTLLATRLGLSPHDVAVSRLGGNSPQRLLSEAAAEIQAGHHDAVIICGAEAAHTVALARRVGHELPWTPDTITAADTPEPPRHAAETAVGLRSVREYFPLIDNAIRARHGSTTAEHAARIGRMWSNYSEVAAHNPYAWSPRARTPDEITTVTADNRMISFPYTKLMNAYARVDQAAALILCSVQVARAARIPEDRWVFPLAGADCHEHWFVSERDDLGTSVGMRANADAVFDAARLTIDDIQHIDLYACFPAPPQLAAEALGVAVDDTRRPLTCTGGLAFAGGPGNNYMTHVVANIVERLRADSGAHALAAGVGWYATTHSIGVYGTESPGDGFRHIDAQAAVDNTPRRAVAEAYDGPATLETFTVTHGRDGEREMAFAAALTLDGARVWASSTDSDVMLALETGELLGSPVEIKEGSLRC